MKAAHSVNTNASTVLCPSALLKSGWYRVSATKYLNFECCYASKPFLDFRVRDQGTKAVHSSNLSTVLCPSALLKSGWYRWSVVHVIMWEYWCATRPFRGRVRGHGTNLALLDHTTFVETLTVLTRSVQFSLTSLNRLQKSSCGM